MNIGSVLGVQTTSDGATAGTTGSDKLGRDDFLKLLLVQLQMQNPLEPMDNEAMIAQLAQFSSLEQMESMNSALQQNLEMDLLIGQLLNNTMSTTLIGKGVRAGTQSFVLPKEEPVELGYRLVSDADAVSITVEDSTGLTVVSLDDLGNTEGDHVVSWDGRDDNGNRVAPGTYRFVVKATDSEGNPLGAEEMIVGVVEAVRYRDGNARLMIGETEVFMSDILEIYEDHS